MFIPVEWLSVVIVALMGALCWYLGFSKGIARGAERMFDELENDDFLRTRRTYNNDIGEWEKELIEPEWTDKKQKNPS